MKTWQIQHARNNLCRIVKAAQQGHAQELTRHGEAVAVVISMKDYRNLAGKKKGTMAGLIKRSKGLNVELDIKRSKKAAREIEL
ncbi:MAG TPA: type II toxin-antitoxin system Phd/YefM family antitoxin [Verrucomicrobiae bacterium]